MGGLGALGVAQVGLLPGLRVWGLSVGICEAREEDGRVQDNMNPGQGFWLNSTKGEALRRELFSGCTGASSVYRDYIRYV